MILITGATVGSLADVYTLFPLLTAEYRGVPVVNVSGRYQLLEFAGAVANGRRIHSKNSSTRLVINSAALAL